MTIRELKLKNFRNYENLNIKFSNSLNIIIGDNAQGKTNILEAIYFLSITKSNLTNNDRNCIKTGQLFTRIDCIVDSAKNDSNNLSIFVNSNGKKISINKKEIKKHSDYIGNLKVILFNPDNIRLIKDAPQNRRRFLNIEISQLSGKYIDLLNEYNIVLKQRNEYLKVVKKGKINNVYFDILTDKLIDIAVSVYKYRVSFISNINKYISDIFKNIAGYDNLMIEYNPSIAFTSLDEIKNNMKNKLNESYQKELFNGTTLYGPHRDDFSFKLEDNDLLIYGSQGQQKLAILALKLAEINVFFDECEEYPIVLLDDLFSELDIDKRNKVINYLNKNIQTIISTTDLNDINSSLIDDACIFKIANGVIVE